ncbi:MAG TPA: hotdog domain-containing protein [Hyphomicrobiaceae bacterium]|nr:hotdog domain-containing protein [Hyphomicrobiaceae bacterium]
MAGFGVTEAQAFLDDRAGLWLGELRLVVDAVTDDGVMVRLRYRDPLASADGRVGPSALGAAAEGAMALAISAPSGKVRAMRLVDQTTNFIRAVERSDVVVAGRVVRLGKSIAFAAAEIRLVSTNELVVRCTGTYALA